MNKEWLVFDEWLWCVKNYSFPLLNQDLPLALSSTSPTLAHCHYPRSYIDDPHTSVPLTRYPNPDEPHDQCICIPRTTGATTRRVILNDQCGIADEGYDKHLESSSLMIGNGSLHTCISLPPGPFPVSHHPCGGPIKHTLP